jgi:hypothetical protein
MYRFKFDKTLDNAMEVLRLFCIAFWGPLMMTECSLTIAYYKEITTGCATQITDAFLNVMVYVLIIFTCVSLIITIFLCFSLYHVGRTIKDLWPRLRNPIPVIVANQDPEEAVSIRSDSVLSRRNSTSINLDIDFEEDQEDHSIFNIP